MQEGAPVSLMGLVTYFHNNRVGAEIPTACAVSCCVCCSLKKAEEDRMRDALDSAAKEKKEKKEKKKDKEKK